MADVIPIRDREIVMNRRELSAILDTMSEDEILLVLELARKYIAGRDKYGPLELKTDQRDFVHEQRTELKDYLFYMICETLKRQI